MNPPLRIATYNLHKGVSTFYLRHVLPAQRRALEDLDLDLVFLQEVQGRHVRRARRHADWPAEPQQAVLADGRHHAYGANAVYGAGHHGNAIVSRHAILGWQNQDLSLGGLERRGLLHARIDLPGGEAPLHALCVHLNLRAADRRRQLEALAAYVATAVPADARLILAGDFNDWREEACEVLRASLGVHEAFRRRHGRLAASFPVRRPLLRLDRIYVRGLEVVEARVHSGAPWAGLSDHAPLSAVLVPR